MQTNNKNAKYCDTIMNPLTCVKMIVPQAEKKMELHLQGHGFNPKK